MNEQPLSRGRFIRIGVAAGGSVLLGGRLLDDAAFASTPVPPKPTQLIVRSWQAPWGTAIAKYAGEPFTKNTGIKLVWDYTDPGPLQTKVSAAIRAGPRPPVDMLHTISLVAA